MGAFGEERQAMGTPERAPAGDDGAPDSVRRLLDSRATTAELLERLLASVQRGAITFAPHTGTQLLLFRCRGVPCALPLTSLREVLPEVPKPIFLPFTPDWMLGIFALRTELVGLVDPAPLLFGAGAAAAGIPWAGGDGAGAAPSASLIGVPGARPAATVLLVGTEERCLAWMVDAVGDIVHARDDQVLAPSDAGGATVPVAARYVAGVYRDGDATHEASAVLHAQTLLDDLLAALTEEGAVRHG